MSAPLDVRNTIIAEAVGEGEEGMAGVIASILNRSAIRGLTPEQVVRQKYQYTGYSNPGAGAKRSQSDPEITALVDRLYDDMLENGVPAKFADMDHYLNPRDATDTSWSQTFERQRKKKVTEGNHVFYASGPKGYKVADEADDGWRSLFPPNPGNRVVDALRQRDFAKLPDIGGRTSAEDAILTALGGEQPQRPKTTAAAYAGTDTPMQPQPGNQTPSGLNIRTAQSVAIDPSNGLPVKPQRTNSFLESAFEKLRQSAAAKGATVRPPNNFAQTTSQAIAPGNDPSNPMNPGAQTPSDGTQFSVGPPNPGNSRSMFQTVGDAQAATMNGNTQPGNPSQWMNPQTQQNFVRPEAQRQLGQPGDFGIPHDVRPASLGPAPADPTVQFRPPGNFAQAPQGPAAPTGGDPSQLLGAQVNYGSHDSMGQQAAGQNYAAGMPQTQAPVVQPVAQPYVQQPQVQQPVIQQPVVQQPQGPPQLIGPVPKKEGFEMGQYGSILQALMGMGKQQQNPIIEALMGKGGPSRAPRQDFASMPRGGSIFG